MRSNTDSTTVGYRSKGPNGSKTMCAIGFSAPLLNLMNNPERVQIIVQEPLYEWDERQIVHALNNGPPRWTMHLAPNPRGYKMNFKPGSVQGEIAIAWAELGALFTNKDGKGRLNCELVRGVLIVDISDWSESTPTQDVLFEKWGRVLLP